MRSFDDALISHPVRQGRRLRWVVTAIAVLLLGGLVLPGSFSKEDVLAIVGGSSVLLIASWCPSRLWHEGRFVATPVVATYIAFAGIVGLEAPDATSSWLAGAGLASLGRYWIDHLIRADERRSADEVRTMLKDLASRPEIEAPTTQRAPLWAAVLALLAGVLLGRTRNGRH